MTVKELINELKTMPQDLPILAEGEFADKVIVEKYSGEPQAVRIFKTWDIEFIDSPTKNL